MGESKPLESCLRLVTWAGRAADIAAYIGGSFRIAVRFVSSMIILSIPPSHKFFLASHQRYIISLDMANICLLY